MVCVKYRTVQSIAQRYIANGGHIRLREPGNPMGRRFLNDNQMRWILGQQTLERWRCRSLAWRAAKIERAIGHSITASGLRQIYIRHGIKFSPSQYKFKGNYTHN
jgi:hypothetical protein